MSYSAYVQVDAQARTEHDAAMSVAQALSDLFGPLTQTQVADHLTSAGCPVDQTKVSRWKRGVTQPPVMELLAIERAFDRPPGWVLARAGLVPMSGVEPLTPPVADRLAALSAQVEELAARLDRMQAQFEAVTGVVVDSPSHQSETPARQSPGGAQ